MILRLYKDYYSQPKIHATGKAIIIVDAVTAIKIKIGIPINIAMNAI